MTTPVHPAPRGRHRATVDGSVVPRWVAFELLAIAVLGVAGVVWMLVNGDGATVAGAAGTAVVGAGGTVVGASREPTRRQARVGGAAAILAAVVVMVGFTVIAGVVLRTGTGCASCTTLGRCALAVITLLVGYGVGVPLFRFGARRWREQAPTGSP